MTEEQVRIGKDGAVAHVELNRPESLNAWNPVFGQELLDAVRAVSADPEVRAILLTGTGRAFCSGADLKGEMRYLPNGDVDVSTPLRDIYNEVILEVRRAPKPVVAGIHGAAAGIGASLALASDLVVAGESSYLLLAFVNIGLIPDGGAIRFLAERVGLARAAELAMLGERLPAPKALDWGVVNRVVADDAVQSEAMALAQHLAAMPTLAIANIKRTLVETAHDNLAHDLRVEADRQQEHGGSFDFMEGVTAFVEKRAPQFLGR